MRGELPLGLGPRGPRRGDTVIAYLVIARGASRALDWKGGAHARDPNRRQGSQLTGLLAYSCRTLSTVKTWLATGRGQATGAHVRCSRRLPEATVTVSRIFIKTPQIRCSNRGFQLSSPILVFVFFREPLCQCAPFPLNSCYLFNASVTFSK